MSEPRTALGVGVGVFLGFNVDLPLPFLLQCYLLARGFIISKVPPAVELRTEKVEEVFIHRQGPVSLTCSTNIRKDEKCPLLNVLLLLEN